MQRYLRFIDTVEKDPSAPGVPLIAALCTSVNSLGDFDTDAYWYEVLGGQHTALARKEVAKKQPDNMQLQQVLA